MHAPHAYGKLEVLGTARRGGVIASRIVLVADVDWFRQSNTGIILTAIGVMPRSYEPVEGIEHDVRGQLDIGTRRTQH
jgi:hypothetical protein